MRCDEPAGMRISQKIHENALAHESRQARPGVAQQYGIKVDYDDVIVREYTADPVVEAAIVVELQAVKTLDSVHTAQSINDLKASGLQPGLLLNFGKPRVEVHRVANGI